MVIVSCFASIHFTYETDHEPKNLKIPSISGKFPTQLLYIGPFPSYQSKSTTIHQIHQNFTLSNFCTIGYIVEHLACLKTQECEIKGPEFSRHFSLDHAKAFHIPNLCTTCVKTSCYEGMNNITWHTYMLAIHYKLRIFINCWINS